MQRKRYLYAQKYKVEHEVARAELAWQVNLLLVVFLESGQPGAEKIDLTPDLQNFLPDLIRKPLNEDLSPGQDSTSLRTSGTCTNEGEGA